MYIIHETILYSEHFLYEFVWFFCLVYRQWLNKNSIAIDEMLIFNVNCGTQLIFRVNLIFPTNLSILLG